MHTVAAKLRLGLPPVPERMAHLPIDPDRGYPVPWFVPWVKGKPEFRAADGRKRSLAIRRNLCWVCGQPNDSLRAFVLGPMCTVNRVSAEPPCHKECALFSVRACPFLTKPHMGRGSANSPELEANKDKAPGFMIDRNPGCSAVWITRRPDVFDAGNGVLFDVGEPVEVTWWREGRTATRAEVVESIDSGLPILAATCDKDVDPSGSREELARRRVAMEVLLPAV